MPKKISTDRSTATRLSLRQRQQLIATYESLTPKAQRTIIKNLMTVFPRREARVTKKGQANAATV